MKKLFTLFLIFTFFTASILAMDPSSLDGDALKNPDIQNALRLLAYSPYSNPETQLQSKQLLQKSQNHRFDTMDGKIVKLKPFQIEQCRTLRHCIDDIPDALSQETSRQLSQTKMSVKYLKIVLDQMKQGENKKLIVKKLRTTMQKKSPDIIDPSVELLHASNYLDCQPALNLSLKLLAQELQILAQKEGYDAAKKRLTSLELPEELSRDLGVKLANNPIKKLQASLKPIDSLDAPIAWNNIYSSDGNFSAKISSDQLSLRIKNTLSRRRLTMKMSNNERFIGVSFSSQNNYFATVHQNGDINIIDLTENKNTHAFRTAKKNIIALCFSPNNSNIAYAVDRMVYIQNLRETICENYFHLPSSPISCLAYSPDGNLLVIGTKNADTHLWDLKKNSHIGTFRNPDGAFSKKLSFSQDGHFLAIGSLGAIHIFDVIKQQYAATLAYKYKDKPTFKYLYFDPHTSELIVGVINEKPYCMYTKTIERWPFILDKVHSLDATQALALYWYVHNSGTIPNTKIFADLHLDLQKILLANQGIISTCLLKMQNIYDYFAT